MRTATQTAIVDAARAVVTGTAMRPEPLLLVEASTSMTATAAT